MTLGEEEYPGLDLLMAVALAEREAQADDFRALDAKAATLAVFPATLAALTVGGWPPLVVLACVFAGLTVWRSICALSLRTVGLPSTMELREQYLSREDQEEACLEVLDSLLVYVIDELVRQNELKADDISKAMRYAVVAAAAALTSVLVEPLLAIIRWTGAIS